MSPETKFHSIILGVTVSLMFMALTFILPWVAHLHAPEKVLAGFIAVLISAGTYGPLAKGLDLLLRKWRLLKRWVLGPAYLEGTWVGYYVDHGGNVFYVVENYEQEFTSLHIQGTSYDEGGQRCALWSSDSWNIDTAKKRLNYSYNCRFFTSDAKDHQGVAVFDLKRDSSTAPAHRLDGYSADLTNGLRSPAVERKAADRILDDKEGLKRARKFAAEQKAASKR